MLLVLPLAVWRALLRHWVALTLRQAAGESARRQEASGAAREGHTVAQTAVPRP